MSFSKFNDLILYIINKIIHLYLLMEEEIFPTKDSNWYQRMSWYEAMEHYIISKFIFTFISFI